MPDSPPTSDGRAEPTAEQWKLGARAVAPMLIGVIPFGVVAGASPVAKGLGAATACGFSLIVFAGSSQLAAIDVLGRGGSAAVAIIAALTINLRHLLYSASLAPHMASMPLSHRVLAAYFTTDQAYAVSITRWTGAQPRPPRLAYFLGAGVFLWAVWQVSTVAGAVLGSALPASVPLDVAVPLVFLVLLVPAVTNRPAAIAASIGGAGAVAAAQAGAGSLAIVFGAVAGIAAGVATELRCGGQGVVG